MHRKTDPLTVDITEFDCPPACGDPYVVGVGYVDAVKDLPQSILKSPSAIDVIRDTIETAIKADPDRQSSPPVQILHLTKDWARWIQNENQCPEIRVTNPSFTDQTEPWPPTAGSQ